MKLIRRRTLLWILAIIVALGVVTEFVISRILANRLASIMQERLGAHVECDQAWYVPPFGMMLRGVRVTRDGQEIISLAGLNVKLDRLPTPGRQIVIESIDIRQPIVRIFPAGIRAPAKAGEKKPPQKLSTLFRLTRLEIQGGQVSYEIGAQPMIWGAINVKVDTTRQSDAKYSFTLSAGDGEDLKLESKGNIDVDELALDLSELKFSARSASDLPPQSLPPAIQQALRESRLSGEVKISLAGSVNKSEWSLRDLRGGADFKEAGRIEISGTASGPTNLAGKPWWDAVTHEFTIQPHDLSLQPRKLPSRLEHIDGAPATIVGGVVQFRDLTATYGNNEIELRAARLDLKDLPANISFREIDSTVTFAGKPGDYSPTLDALRPSGPFVIGGEYTIVRADPGRQRYDLRISSDTASLNLLDGKLPLKNLRGDARIVPGRFEMETFYADVFGGIATGRGFYTFGDSQTCKGHLTVRQLDLHQLATLDVKNRSEKVRGRGFLDAQFDGDFTQRASLNALHATGQAEVLDGEFYEIPVLRELFGAIKPAKKAVTAGEAATLFELKDGIIRLHRAAINAPILGLQGGGEIGLDGRINAEVVAAPLADWRDKLKETKIPIISNVAGEIVGGVQRLLDIATGTLLYQFRIEGTVEKPKIVPVPVPVLTDTAALLFGKMLGQKKDQRLVDFLKQ